MPGEYLLIEIGFVGDTERRLNFKPCGQHYVKMVSQLIKGLE
jgi:hypothetical protein